MLLKRPHDVAFFKEVEVAVRVSQPIQRLSKDRLGA